MCGTGPHACPPDVVLLRQLLRRPRLPARDRPRRLRRPLRRRGAERPRLRRAVPSREIVERRPASAQELRRMAVIPSIALLQGNAVRLQHGDFTLVTKYGDAEAVLDALDVPRGSRLHVVDLEGSRSGRPHEVDVVRRLAKRDLRVQVGGGIRSIADARTWLDAGAEKVVVGTVAADSPEVLRAIVEAVGAERVIAAVDVRDGVVRVAGWERDASASLAEVLARVEAAGIREALVTDIRKDGALRGPSFDLYRSLVECGGHAAALAHPTAAAWPPHSIRI